MTAGSRTPPADLHLAPRLLLGPGPSEVHPRVLRAMATPLIGHMDPQLFDLLAEIQVMLRLVFGTTNELTLVVPGSGMAGMEACLVNLLEPDDEAVVCVHGAFGARMCQIVERCGARLTRVDAPWGEPVDPARVKEALARARPKLVAIVHGETSTGVLQPLDEIGRLAREAGALFVVDAVTTLGGVEVALDARGIDAAYAGSQKCLSAPPGLAPISFGPRAVEALERRRRAPQSWYLDLALLRKYWGPERVYHHTTPVSGMYALREALRIVLEEGLEARFARHRRNHELLAAGLAELGLDLVASPAHRLPMLTVVRTPAGVDEAAIRRRLLQEHAIEIAGGLGEFAGKIWRIGLMGQGSSAANVQRLLAALRSLLGQAAGAAGQPPSAPGAAA